MKMISLTLITLFSIVSLAQTEKNNYWVTKDMSSAYLIKTLSADTQFIATSNGSSEAKVTLGENITKLALATPIKSDGYIVRGQSQVRALTTITHVEFLKVDDKMKIRELGSTKFPDNADLKTESLTEEYEISQVIPQPVKLSLRSQDYLVLPSSSSEVFRAQLKDLKAGVGTVLLSNQMPVENSSFLVGFDVSTTQKPSVGFDSMKVRLSNGDSIEYFGLNKPTTLNSHFVYGIYTSKADKQVNVFTARMAKDSNYSSTSTNLLTKDLVSGKYYDEVYDGDLEFKDNGVLIISSKSDKSFVLALAWKVNGSEIEAIRYGKEKGDYSLLTESEVLVCIEKPSTCSVNQSRKFLPLKIDDSGMSVMRTMFWHRNHDDQTQKEMMGINLQVLKKAE